MQRLLTTSAMAALFLTGCSKAPAPTTKQVSISSRAIPVIEQDGLTFRDLNNDGLLTPYEDWRLSPEARAEDLVARMTLEEKAGQMVHGTLPGLQGFAGFSSVGFF